MDGSVEVPASFHSSSPGLLLSPVQALPVLSRLFLPLYMFLELLFHTASNIWAHGR